MSESAVVAREEEEYDDLGEGIFVEEREAAMERNGIPGFWFEREWGLQILSDLQDLPLARQEVSLLDQQLSLRMEQLDRMREALTIEREIHGRMTQELESALVQAQEAEAKSNTWYRRPGFLIATGVVLTLVLEIGAVFLFVYLAN